MDTNVTGLLNALPGGSPSHGGAKPRSRGQRGSIAGYQVYPGGNVYNASKFAVRALSEGMNVDLAERGSGCPQ